MKYVLIAALLAAATLFASASTLATPRDTTPAPALIKLSYLSQPAQRSDLLQPARPQARPVQLTASLISCWFFQGNHCPTQGSAVRCQWQPYGSGICVCESGNKWACY